MAGHSKFKNIQHRKSRQDRVKSAKNIYFAQAIYTLAKNSKTTDTELNRLIERAKANDVSNDVIERALNKVNEPQTGEIIYYAATSFPHFVIIKCNIDNKNKFNLIKSVFSHCNFAVTPLNGCEYMFDMYTILAVNSAQYNVNDLFEIFNEYAIDIIENNETIIVYSNINTYGSIHKLILQHNIDIEYMNIGYMPKKLETSNENLEKLIDELHEYCEEIYTNTNYIPVICS